MEPIPKFVVFKNFLHWIKDYIWVEHVGFLKLVKFETYVSARNFETYKFEMHVENCIVRKLS